MKGNGQCTLACDTDNHHIHTYCNRCKKNLPYGTTVHKCRFTSEEHGFVMNPKFLVNEPWWTEPLLVQQANAAVHLRYLQRLICEFPFYSNRDIDPIRYLADLD